MLEDKSISLITNKGCTDQVIGDSNQVNIRGIIEDELKYVCPRYFTPYYETRVRINRWNGKADFLPIIVSEPLMRNYLNCSLKGKIVQIVGKFKSCKITGKDGRNHLKLYVDSEEFNVYNSEDEVDGEIFRNEIFLEGYICKKSNFRKTLNGRYIIKLMLAVKRNYSKADYIPCVAFGKAANDASYMETGDHVKVHGRITSREYFKRKPLEPEEGEYRTAYEVVLE